MIGTKAEYGRSRKERGLPGGTRQAVSQAVDSGRIELTPEGLIDFDAADDAWRRNTSTIQQERAAGGIAAGPDPEDYLAARARKEAALADRAEMEVAELRGDLLRRETVFEFVTGRFAEFRARAILLAPTIAPLVAPAGRIAEVQAIIQKYAYEMLNELAADGIPGSAVE